MKEIKQSEAKGAAKMKLLKELTYQQYNSITSNKCGVCGQILTTDQGEWIMLEDGTIRQLGKNCRAKILKQS